MIRLDSSTDSGLGRSNELSATSTMATASSSATSATITTTMTTTTTISNPTTTIRNSTIVHLGEVHQISLRDRLKSRTQVTSGDGSEPKRHSIAVEQIKYVQPGNDGQSTRITLNGGYMNDVNNANTINNNMMCRTSNPTKRVEFCKTEVHFATESGRVNIVETDTKPPPTQNFRRRRRNSHAGQTDTEVIRNRNLTDIEDHFPRTSAGNSLAACGVLAGNGAIWRTHHRTSLERSPEATETIGKVTITTITAPADTSSRSSGIESTDGEMDDANIALRGILKNKLTKPKPYVLGENNNSLLWPNNSVKNNEQSIVHNNTMVTNSPPVQQFETTNSSGNIIVISVIH